MVQARLLHCGGDGEQFGVGQGDGFFDGSVQAGLFRAYVVDEKLPVGALPAQFVDDGVHQRMPVVEERETSLFFLRLGVKGEMLVRHKSPAGCHFSGQERFIDTVGRRLHQPARMAAVAKYQFFERGIFSHSYSAAKSSPKRASSYSLVFWWA